MRPSGSPVFLLFIVIVTFIDFWILKILVESQAFVI